MIKLRHFKRERMRLCARRLYVCLQSFFTCCMKGESQNDHDQNVPRPAKDLPDFTKKSKGKTPKDPQAVERPPGTFKEPRSSLFEDDYTIKCSLGAGAFARTVLVSRKATGSISVAKIPLEKGSCKSEIHSEIAALSTLDHLNIIKLVDVAKDRGCKIIITEYCPGGTLLAAMERHSKSPSLAWGHQIISYFKQLVSAVSYMHSNQWAHLDLKQDNVVLSADLKVVKVIDFGLSIRTSKVYQRQMKSELRMKLERRIFLRTMLTSEE
ncbi:calcium-dependent protein kinase 1-like [Oratosquilla oratoria]|uniref:calcium-dependent protein kinase 1-like n=1 Tax=Oratosquilla oratoria TaxID=337810 RepID=UPI003F75BE42